MMRLAAGLYLAAATLRVLNAAKARGFAAGFVRGTRASLAVAAVAGGCEQ